MTKVMCPSEVIDPDKILKEIRELLAEYPDNAYLAMRIRELFKQLDEYLSAGGPPPLDWDWNPLWPQQRQEKTDG